MAEPKDRNDRQNAPGPNAEPGAEPKKGGFGAFADKYRARWEAEHPKTDKANKQGSPPRESQSEQDSSSITDRPAKP